MFNFFRKIRGFIRVLGKECPSCNSTAPECYGCKFCEDHRYLSYDDLWSIYSYYCKSLSIDVVHVSDYGLKFKYKVGDTVEFINWNGQEGVIGIIHERGTTIVQSKLHLIRDGDNVWGLGVPKYKVTVGGSRGWCYEKEIIRKIKEP